MIMAVVLCLLLPACWELPLFQIKTDSGPEGNGVSGDTDTDMDPDADCTWTWTQLNYTDALLEANADQSAIRMEGFSHPAMVWTGTEMIVWGGRFARCGHVAVWTGEEMIVWGGRYRNAGGTNGYLGNTPGYKYHCVPN